MKKQICLFFVMLMSLSFILSACGNATTASTTTAGSASSSITIQVMSSQTSATTATATTGTTGKTSAPTTTPGTTKPIGTRTEKLDVLSSYNIVLTAEAMTGSAKGVVNKYDADHLPAEKAYHSVWSASRDGGDFKMGEECIVIGSSQWVKPYGKSWTTGSSIAAGHITMLSGLYLALSNGTLQKIDEATVSGIPVIHYSYLYETKSTRMRGEVWIANQNGLQAVPLKAANEQMALDEKGAVIDDYRHIKFAYEVKNVNAKISIKAPI